MIFRCVDVYFTEKPTREQEINYMQMFEFVHTASI